MLPVFARELLEAGLAGEDAAPEVGQARFGNLLALRGAGLQQDVARTGLGNGHFRQGFAALALQQLEDVKARAGAHGAGDVAYAGAAHAVHEQGGVAVFIAQAEHVAVAAPVVGVGKLAR